MPRQTLDKRTDGRYKCKYKNKQFYGKTQEEALKKRDEWIKLELQGMDLSRYGTTFREYGRQFVLVYRNECSQAQRNQYYGLIDFVDQFLNKKEMADITATELQKITNKLNVYSNSYIGKYMTTMRGIFRTAAADGVIIRNPMDKVKRPKGKACEGHRALEDWERQLIIDTYEEHDFGLAAMTMLFTGIRKGEMLYMDIDRDIDFQNKTVAVRGAVTFSEGNQGKTSKGKTQAAQRVIPLVKPLEDALKGKHGLICPKKDGKQMSQIGIERKYESYISFLETKVNGCHKRWYGLTKEHKMKLDMGEELPPWKDITIRCHDFRVDFCTRCYEAGIPLKTLQSWMGHADTTMIMKIYAKLTDAKELEDGIKLAQYMESNVKSTRPVNLKVV